MLSRRVVRGRALTSRGSNSGDVTLSEVKVTDPLSPDCDRNLGTLAAGASKTYSCTRADLKAGFTNVATATGKPPTGPKVSAQDSAVVKVASLQPPKVIAKHVVKAKPKPKVVADVAPKNTG